MPIYTNKLTSQQYKVVTKIDIKTFKKLLDNFIKAKNTFPYKDKYYFLKSIELDEAGKSLKLYDVKVIIDDLVDTNLSKIDDKFPFISKFYNDPKLNITDYNYGMMMESLINHANSLLPSSSKYKYDIVGSWTNGKVIIMQKK
jgi:hypothetical protein